MHARTHARMHARTHTHTHTHTHSKWAYNLKRYIYELGQLADGHQELE